jgi:uncharacterized protein YciI
MPLFAIIAFDAPDSKVKRADYVKPHVEALVAMKNQGRLFAAGPLRESLNDSAEKIGSLLIIDFNSQTDAEEWFQNEPFFKAGVYKTVTIKPYEDAMDFISSYV